MKLTEYFLIQFFWGWKVEKKNLDGEKSASKILKVHNGGNRERVLPLHGEFSIWTRSDNLVESLTKVPEQMKQRMETRHETCRHSVNK